MNHNNFKREHESFSLTINASAEKIFSLACPFEELKWINEWAYAMVYSYSGKNENNCIFAETMSSPVFASTEKTEPTFWVTTLYDSENYIIHWLLVRNSTVTKLEVTQKAISPEGIVVAWDMTITAIKEEGNSCFDAGLKNRMKLMMTLIGQSLKHYCETGTKLIFSNNQ